MKVKTPMQHTHSNNFFTTITYPKFTVDSSTVIELSRRRPTTEIIVERLINDRLHKSS